MKKNLFLILVTSLLVLILIYFYDKREEVLNKEYRDYDNNVYIEYPYFNNIVIDNYLSNYLNGYIKNGDILLDSLYIDYDYEELEDKINLTMYIYEEKEQSIKRHTKKLEIDTSNNTIKEKKKTIDTNIEHNICNEYIIGSNAPMIALTFDDGPNHNTSRILDILEKYNVKATFFVLGTNISGREEIIKRMKKLNMEIGNHMYSHKLLTKLKEEEIKEELSKVDNLVYDIIKEYPTLIRPSYGTINKKINKIMDRPIIIWNIDTLDWKYHNSKNIANRVLKHANDGDIILMHDIYRATANSLEIIIPKLLEKNYRFVTVSELLYYKGIDLVPGRVYSNVSG